MKRVIWSLLVIGLVLIAMPVVAAPAFTLNSVEPVGGGVSQFNYTLSNSGGAVPIYDLEVDYYYAAGWIAWGGPSGWEGSTDFSWYRWATDTNPCSVGYSMEGFWIQAATPSFGNQSVYFTDVSHQQVGTATAQLPIPEPASMLALGSGLLGLAGTIVRRRR